MIHRIERLSCWILASLMAFLIIGTGSTARAVEAPVFRIGAFDASSGEFRADSDAARRPGRARDPIVHIDPASGLPEGGDAAWRRHHPGSASAYLGARPHPYTILFQLSDPPTGVMHLEIAVIYATPRLSSLELDLNGHRGRFYFDPVLDHSGGDAASATIPHTSVARKSIALPASFFVRGENKLVLTAIDEAPTDERASGAAGIAYSGFTYDALELRYTPLAGYDFDSVMAHTKSTIFYRTTSAGPRNVVKSRFRFGRTPKSGEARLEIDGKQSKRDFSSEYDFGEVEVEFEVSPWQGVAKGELSLTASGLSWSEPVALEAGRRWTLLVIPSIHLDLGFTQTAAQVEEVQSAALDLALAESARDPEYRYLVDGAWVVERYLAGRSKERGEALLTAIREGRIGLPPQFANINTGTASLEGLIRSLAVGADLAARHDLPLNPPHISDVPSYSGSYASVLAASGMRAFIAGSNNWRAPVLLKGRWHEKSPFEWQGPDGGSVVMWYARGYAQLESLFGVPQQERAIRHSLPVFLKTYDRPDYRAQSVILFGSEAENKLTLPGGGPWMETFAAQYAWPKFRQVTSSEAIAQIRTEWEGEFPVVRGDFGSYWEDGVGSDARSTALQRTNHHRIESAETLASVASALDPSLRADAARLAEAWREILLYDEHTWNSVLASSQPSRERVERMTRDKASRSARAAQAIDGLIDRGFAQLASSVALDKFSVAVFNSRSQTRSGLVEIDLSLGLVPVDPVTQKPVAYEELQREASRLPFGGRGYRRIRFLAEDVPAVGYRVYGLKMTPPAASASPPHAYPLSTREFKSPFYKLTVDPKRGGVASIIDRELDRELVDPASETLLAAPVYVTGGGDFWSDSLYLNTRERVTPELLLHHVTRGRMISARKLSYGTRIEMECEVLPPGGIGVSGAGLQIKSEIILFDHEKKIEIRQRVEKPATLDREALYFSFPFAGSARRFGYASQSAWVDPARDILAGGSLEWFSTTSWVASIDVGMIASVTPLDAPLITLGDVARGSWPDGFDPISNTIYSWPMNNYWPVNFPASQQGSFEFRYVVRSARDFDAARLTRDAARDLSPLEVAELAPAPNPSGRSTPQAASMLEIDNPNLALVIWKRSADGQSIILRLLEIAGQPGRARIRLPHQKIAAAWKTNALEQSPNPIAVVDGTLELSFPAYTILTLQLEIENPSKESFFRDK